MMEISQFKSHSNSITAHPCVIPGSWPTSIPLSKRSSRSIALRIRQHMFVVCCWASWQNDHDPACMPNNHARCKVISSNDGRHQTSQVLAPKQLTAHERHSQNFLVRTLLKPTKTERAADPDKAAASAKAKAKAKTKARSKPKRQQAQAEGDGEEQPPAPKRRHKAQSS